MVNGIRGKTRVCGLFGHPVKHSFSPAMHNAAFRAAGLDYVYVPFQVEPGHLPAAVEGIKALGLAGVNVTIPHKEAVLPLLDELTDEARSIRAVNTILNRDGRLIGDNTDGRGFLRSLQERAGFSSTGKTALVLGAGGAARAVAVQLALDGVGRLFLSNRSRKRTVELAGFIGKKTGVKPEVMDWPDGVREKTLPGEVLTFSDLVVQATPLGMNPDALQTVPLPFDQFRPGQVACDLVYNPTDTVFLKKAGLAGATTVDGLGMLLYQGVLSFELWTGTSAPAEVMKKALEEVFACYVT